MFFTNKAYNVLKGLAQVILPALGTLYFTVAGIWGLPAADKVVGTITAVDAFLGLILAWASKSYKVAADGQILVDRSDPEKTVLSLNAMDTQAINNQDKVTLKVIATGDNQSAMTS